MWTILLPTWISIQISGWRQDHLMDSIQIGCMNSSTLRLWTCERPVVSQPLGAYNWYQIPSLGSLPCNNIRPISLKNMNDSWRIMNNSAKWSWIWDHRWVVRVRSFFGRMVLGMTSLFILLLQRRHYYSLIFIWTFKFVMNIWILYYSSLFLYISILYNFIFLIILFFCSKDWLKKTFIF
jgi:hypothetical protein